MHEGSKRAIVAAFLANLGIAIAKFVAFAMTGAASMLAESIHSVADAGNQGLLALGGRQGRRGPSAMHQFGYGRVRYFWAFVVALVLFTLGGLFAMYEGIEKLRHPHELEDVWWAVSVLLFAIVVESLSFRTAIRAANPLRRGASWLQFVRRSKSPELPVVLLEDLGALVGLVLALTGVTLAQVADEPRFDAMGSLAIGALLVVIAIVLIFEMQSLLIGEAASPGDQQAIIAAIESQDAVVRVIHLRTEHIGPEELLVGAKIAFDPALAMADLAATIDATETRVREAVPHLQVVIYVEPDLLRTGV